LVRMPSTKSGLALPILASTIYLVDTIFSTAQHRRKTVLTGRLRNRPITGKLSMPVASVTWPATRCTIVLPSIRRGGNHACVG
jgi:hypothetical protein